jgi:hypothetical protein
MSKEFLSKLVHYRTYAKYLPEELRRETREETIRRNMDMHIRKFPHLAEAIEKAYEQVFAGRVVPSMRSFQFAGEAIERRNNRMFNCSFLNITKFRDFADLFYMSMSGVGVGFSVKKRHINNLPTIPEGSVEAPYVIADSAEGWCDSLLALFANPDLQFDYTKIRPMGAPLSTGGTASGPKALVKMHANVRAILRKASGRQLTPFECHRIACLIADCVVVGGVRRGALISLFDVDDEEMLNCKAGAWWEKYPELARANNSAVVRKDDPMFDANAGSVIQACFNGGQAEPGLLLTNDDDYGTNPCFSGDTLIAVADGRNAVAIKQLAEEDKDVPVYSVDPVSGEVSIKWARNPRITGKDKELFRVHLDDGSFLDVTGNHKFYLHDGSAKQTKDLVKGDSLFPFRKAPEFIKQGAEKQYYRVHCDARDPRKDKIFEHRLITKFFDSAKWKSLYDETKKAGWISGGLVIHHKDYDSLNNSPDNLEIMTYSEHAALHSSIDNVGEKNGKYSGYTNKQIEDHAIQLTKQLNRRFSSDEWQAYASEHKLPKSFSSFRKNGWFSTIGALASWAAGEVGISPELATVDARTARCYQKALKEGYEARLINGSVEVLKSCEYSSELFWVSYTRREQAYANMQNAAKAVNQREDVRVKMKKASSKRYSTQGEANKQNQMRVFSKLKFDLGREPQKTEWVNACKAENIPTRLDSKHSFKNYIQMKASAALYNHKVVSVESTGRFETVYNLTVDDNHTVGIVTGQKKNKHNNTIFSGVFTAQCGEIALRSYGVCNLTEINAAKCFSKEDWLKAVVSATILGTLQATYTDFKYVQPAWKNNADEEALLGVSITGQAEAQAILTPENLKEGALTAVEVNKVWAAKLGIRPARRITTTKPSGTSSSWLGTTAGVHAGHEVRYVRRVRMDKYSALAKSLAKKFPAFVVDDPFNSNDMIMQVPIKLYDTTLLRSQETAVQCLERVKDLYDHWIVPGHIEGPNTHNISLTINYHEHEKESIKRWMLENRDSYYGISLIPYDGGDYKYLPYSQPPHPEVFEVLEKAFSLIAEDYRFEDIKERKDNTDFKGEVACAGGACSLEI